MVIKMKREIIDKIIKASGIQPGELVLLHFWGEREEEDVLEAFVEAVIAAGASPLELRESRTRNQKRFAVARETCFNEKYFSILEKVDTVLDIFVYQPVVLGARLEDAQMELYRRYMGELFGALANAPRFLQIRIPTEANAMESELEPKEFIKRMEEAYDIDYNQLKARCEAKINQLKETDQITLVTGENHKLTVCYQNRIWNVDAGEGDMPCGEIYIAPQEKLTEGEVFFEKLYVEDTGVFENVLLTVKEGVVIHSSNPDMDAFLQGLGENEKVVCELGFGMNEHVTDLCGYTVLDEKMNDTFHIAIGANVMFGGENQANLHMDFVGKAKIQK